MSIPGTQVSRPNCEASPMVLAAGGGYPYC
jgi:hypothetical protein